MWSVSLLWKKLKWLLMLDLVYFADCGSFFTTSILKVSYIHNVTEKNHMIFALKADVITTFYLYSDTARVGAVVFGYNWNRKQSAIAIGCAYQIHIHGSDFISTTKYSWLWVRWDGIVLEYGTGKIPGLNVVHSYAFTEMIKFVGFAKYSGDPKTYWIVDQTNKLINESVFKRTKGRRMKDISNVKCQVKSTLKCANLCLSLNGCYGFNLSSKVNGLADCELILKQMIYTLCSAVSTLDWIFEEDSRWTHYYL